MTIEKGYRKFIASRLREGVRQSKIAKMLNGLVARSSVYAWCKRIPKTGIAVKTSTGRPRSVRTKSFIAKVKRNLKTNKKRKSARRIAREEGCDHKTVLNAARQDLGLYPYKKIKVPALTSDHIAERKSWSGWIRRNFNREGCRTIVHVDEKYYDQDGQLNRQNDRVYAESREAANEAQATHPKHKYPFKVMVCMGISYNGITDIVIMPEKTTIDSNYYFTHVLPVYKRCGKELIGEDFILMHDQARAHTDAETRKAMDELGIIYVEYCANSPDVMPMDYFFWNEVETMLKGQAYKTRDQLIEAIIKATRSVSLRKIRDAIDAFRSRVYEVEKNKGALTINKYR